MKNWSPASKLTAIAAVAAVLWVVGMGLLLGGDAKPLTPAEEISEAQQSVLDESRKTKEVEAALSSLKETEKSVKEISQSVEEVQRLADEASKARAGGVMPSKESRVNHVLVVEDGKGGYYQKVGDRWWHYSKSGVLQKKLTPLEVTDELIEQAKAERAAFDKQMTDNGQACLL